MPKIPMETIFSRTQLVVAFSAVIFFVVVMLSAAAFADLSFLSLTLPETFYLLSALVLVFLVLSIALTTHLFLQWLR